MATAAPPAVTPPAALAAPDTSTHIDLDAVRAARRAPVEAKPAETVEDDPDVVADPDLAAAIDEIEKPADNETPQQKAARTRKYKESASKSQKTRYKNQRDAATTRAEQAEAELAEWRAGKRAHQATVTDTPAAEPSKDDPRPLLKDFPLEKFTDEDDPYEARSAALAEAVARWGARDEHRKQETTARASRQREQDDQDAQALGKAFDESFVEARTRVPDFDAVVQAARFDRTPRTGDLLDLTMKSDVKADMAYHFAKHPEITNRLLRLPDRESVVLAFAEERASVKAALKATEKPTASPKVTATTEPTQPVGTGTGSGAVLRNPMLDTGTSIDLDEVRAFKRGRH
jgi:hypothetical protein